MQLRHEYDAIRDKVLELVDQGEVYVTSDECHPWYWVPGVKKWYRLEQHRRDALQELFDTGVIEVEYSLQTMRTLLGTGMLNRVVRTEVEAEDGSTEGSQLI